LATILGGGMSSRLFLEIRERRGLAYAVKTAVERYQETGYLCTYVGADPKRVEEAIAVTLSEHYKILNSKSQILNSELAKAREYLKGHLALAMEDTNVVNSFFAEPVLFQQKVLTPEEINQKIDTVRLDDIYFEAKRLFVPERLNLAIIGPYQDKEKFVKLLK
jgi:predicted Zn-dependent peptidase